VTGVSVWTAARARSKVARRAAIGGAKHNSRCPALLAPRASDWRWQASCSARERRLSARPRRLRCHRSRDAREIRANEGRHGLGPDARGMARAGLGAAGRRLPGRGVTRKPALLSGSPSRFPLANSAGLTQNPAALRPRPPSRSLGRTDQRIPPRGMRTTRSPWAGSSIAGAHAAACGRYTHLAFGFHGLARIHRVGRSVPSGPERRMTSCAGL
jgi:hypothetical protein